jgi:hypothetical protein
MYFRVLIVTLFLLGCSIKQPTLKEQKEQIETLAVMLMALSPKVDGDEAYHLAKYSILYSQRLAHEYEVVSSPWINNTLVNFGIKERGLCHEWTEDLLRFLIIQNYQTLELHSVGANVGYLNEHNALVVSARGDEYFKGILLDAWRASGSLYFIKVKEDSEYKWIERRGLYRVLK